MRHPAATQPFPARLAPELLDKHHRLVGKSALPPCPLTAGQINIGAIEMARESSPLWVWLTFALLAFGTIAYVAGVSIVEYFMTWS